VSVNYATADGTATAGSDYVARSGTLTFAPGTTAQGVAVTVNGDTTVEPNETFSVGLSGASNASIARATGTGTILNDDAVVTVGPASLPAATAGSAYSQTLSASGGTAPYTFAVSAGTLPVGLSLSPAGVLSGTPTSSGSFNFTATATDSGGSPTSGNRAYTLTVASPNVSLPATTLPGGTAGQAYTAAINGATGGIAPYTYTLSAGALPAGVTVNSATGALSGTPTVAGSFAFTLTATDSTTGTAGQASQSYSLSIASPTLSIAPPTLPAGTAGSAYSQTLSASGGTAPYSYALSAGALPAGLTLTTGGVLSGTPTVAGSFAFTVTATDSTAGVAAQASYAYTLSIAAPTLVIAPPTLPAGKVGTAYSQALSTSGGTAPYSYSVSAGTLPAGLTLTAAGVLAGTPTAAGTANFTVSAADARGFGAAQAYTLAIAAAVPAPVAVEDSGATLVDTALTLAVTGNDTGSIDSIAVTTAPSHGTAVVNGVQLVYTPAAGYVGADTLSYTATGPGGTSAPVAVAITVNARPVAVSATAAAVPGEAQTVDLTRNATGGPFVAAALVAVLPANAGTASITRSGPAAAATGTPTTAAAEGPSFLLTFTPNPAFSGQATVRFTLSNAVATSVPADIVFVVAPRPDPTLDAEVRGLIDAQAESTRRFAKAQIDNFQRRLEATHRGERGFDNGLSFQSTSRSHCREAERGVTAQPCSQPTWDADADARAPADAGTSTARTAAEGDLGLWVGGAIRSGSLDKQTQRAGVDFQTDGLSVGADYRAADWLALGAGLGWGRDDSDVGRNGSRSKATAYTLALYASIHPGRSFFFDTLVGYQLLSYDLRRYMTDNGQLAEGNRDGSQWIASVSTGADLQRGDWQITPYARVDMARATLDAYSEAAVAPYALRYEDMDVSTTTGNLGLRLEWRREMSWGQFTPQLRVEYQRDFQGRGDAALSYADIVGVGPMYRTGLSVFDRNRLMLGLGAVFTTEQGLSTRVEYRGVTDGDSGSDQTWMFNVEKKY
jgi:outer membrane autotransporter protein